MNAVDIVWNVMGGAYGAAWTSRYGDHDHTGVWGQGIAKYTHEQIKNAVAEAVKFYKQYPPTLGQFIALCTDAPGADEQILIGRNKAYTSKESSRQWISDLNAMLASAADKGPLSDTERKFHFDALGMNTGEPAKRYAKPGNECAYPGCTLLGTCTTSVSGGGRLYCAEHWNN